jgi:hypothetical protein
MNRWRVNSASNLKIYRGVLMRLIQAVENSASLFFVCCAETFLCGSLVVIGVKVSIFSSAPIHSETIFHIVYQA